ncbi:MAG: hypothetical protein AABW67_05845 [Nanoarchaeota archaeon]
MEIKMTMQVNETTEREIIDRAEKMSDFVKMEYLETCLKKNIDISAEKYCYKKLSELYEKKIMYSEAIKNISRLAELSTSAKDKSQVFMKEAELLIMGEFYDRVDYAFKKAIEFSAKEEFFEKKRQLVMLYKTKIKMLEDKGKVAGVLTVYEHLIHLLTDAEKIEAKKKMLVLYNKLGKVREFMILKKEIETMHGMM